MLAAVCLFIAHAGSTDLLDDLANRYGITVEVVTKPYTWQGAGYVVKAEPVTATDLERYAPLLAKEWSIYPVGLMAKARVKKILLGTNVSVSGQLRAAVPAFDGDTMVYDTNLGAHKPRYQRAIVHHEFFHMIDERMGRLRTDPQWSKLNPEPFQCGKGGDKMRESGVGDLTDKIPGFLTRYGTAAVEEDKAELFSHMIVDPDFVKERAKNDSVVAKKIELLKSRLKDFAGMGDEFWNRK